MSHPRQRLDVEDDTAREHRIRALLEATDAAPSHGIRPPALPPALPATRPHAVPPSPLLARAAAFLPALAAANAALAAAADPTAADIERLPHADAPHIEMNLGLGVFEQRACVGSPAAGPTGSTSAGHNSSSEGHNSEDKSEDEDENEDEGEGEDDSDSDSGGDDDGGGDTAAPAAVSSSAEDGASRTRPNG